MYNLGKGEGECDIVKRGLGSRNDRAGGAQGDQSDSGFPHLNEHLAVPSTDRKPRGRRYRVQFERFDIKVSTNTIENQSLILRNNNKLLILKYLRASTKFCHDFQTLAW